MKRCILCLLIAFFSAQSLHAEVLVYVGTIRRTEPEDSFKAYALKCFIVTNPVTGEVSVIGYGKVGGAKRRDEGSPNVTKYFPLNRSDTSLLDLYTFTYLEDSIGVDQRSLFLRGAQRTVTINRVSGKLVLAQRARTLKGSARNFGAGFGYEYLESEIVATLDETRTVDVNVRNRTVTQVRDEISANLDSLGFNL